MDDILLQLSGFLTVYLGLLLLWFLVTQFPSHKWSLFYARFGTLNSMQLHEMHSCFMTLIVFTGFYVFGVEIEDYLLSASFEHMSRIKLFYTGLMVTQFVFLVALFCLHRLRGCMFAKTTRMVMYMTILYMALLFMQLIARGYFDYHQLNLLHTIGVWVSNIISVVAMSVYPIKQTTIYWVQRRAECTKK